MNPSIDLYHVTRKENIPNILKEGIKPNPFYNYYQDVDEIIETAERKGENVTEFDILRMIEKQTINEFLRDIEFPSYYGRMQLEGEVQPYDAVFFFKSKEDFRIKSVQPNQAVIVVDASKIPARCNEANMEIAEVIFDAGVMTVTEGYSPDNLDKYKRDYKKSIRPLDIKQNKYSTEVMCRVIVPPSAIKKII